MERRAGARGLAAVLFTDIVGSTAIAAEMGDARWRELIARHHRIVRDLLGRHGGHEVDTAGDGFFATFERPADAIRCAADAADAVHDLGIEIRAGIAFGEVEVGAEKPSGLVVNTAARVMSVAGPGDVLVPRSVREIVGGAGFAFEDRGSRRLKGLDTALRLSRVTEVDGRPAPSPLDTEEATARRRDIYPSRSRRLALLVGAAAGALAVTVGLIALVLSGEPSRGDRTATVPLTNAVARIDPKSGEPLPIVELDREPTVLNYIRNPIAAGEGGVWLLEPPLLRHIDPRHADERPEGIQVGPARVMDVVTGANEVWVLAGPFIVWRINPATDEQSPFLELPPGPTWPSGLVVTDVVWVGSSQPGTLIRLDPRTGARDDVETGFAIDWLAATRDHVWIADVIEGAIVHIDPHTLRVGPAVEIEGSVEQLEAQGDTLWTLDPRDGTVTRLDVDSGDETGSARVGGTPTDMTVSEDAVWVADLDGSLYRVDPLTLKVTTVPVGAEIFGVAVDEAEGSLWVFVGEPTGG